MLNTEILGKDSTSNVDGPLNDPAIRSGLLAKPLQKHVLDDDTLVIHELGLAHARRRIDIAVINGVLHGFEIKSAVDSLERLEGQLETYSQSLQKLTFVVADCHVAKVLDRVPSWCGVLRAFKGQRGSMRFEVLQRARRNPSVDRLVLAHLLWRDEARAILAAQGASKSVLQSPRAVLYEALIETATEAQLTALIKSAMKQRQDWIDRSRPS